MVSLPVVPQRLRSALDFLLGEEGGRRWIESALDIGSELCESWRLRPISVLEGGAMSLCFKCSDEEGRVVVLKIPTTPRTGVLEHAVHLYWPDEATPHVWNVDLGSGAFLMDYIEHDATVTSESGILRLTELLHVIPTARSDIPHLESNIDLRMGWALERFGVPDYACHRADLAIAQKLIHKLLSSASSEVLLHGDLQDKNIIGNRGRLMAIDPIPVIGEGVFDVAFWISLYAGGADRRAVLNSVVGHPSGRLWAWTWAMAIVEHRPYLLEGSAERQIFIDEFRADAQAGFDDLIWR